MLAIDADPNSCFADALGVKDSETIVGICDDISKNMDKIPPGVTKDRFIEMKVQESVAETKDFDLLVMGAPEGPGCYCYVNSLLRGIIERISKSYDFVVIDNAAGMEHISRRTEGDITKLLLVSDYSVAGVRAAGNIYTLAKKLKIRIGGAFMLVNRVSGPLSALDEEIKKTGLEMVGDVPYSQALVERNISGSSMLDFADPYINSRIADIFERVMGH